MSSSQSVSSPSNTVGRAISWRPTSKAKALNPREFQINQLRRRFRPVEKDDDLGTSLSFGFAPSDPDFPFELERLQCVLHVPRSYPEYQRPRLRVTNPEMEEIFRDNVARGFDDIVDTTLRFNRRGTLLGWMNVLDRQLERLLTKTERAPTLKFISNYLNDERAGKDVPQQPLNPSQPQITDYGFTTEEKVKAEKRREADMRQIMARLSRLPLFQKGPDDGSFVVPLQPTKKDQLPVPLRSIKAATLMVPRLYPLEPSSIELLGVDRLDAQTVEAGFTQWAKENANLNLMSQINYLANNMHIFAKGSTQQPSRVSYENTLSSPSVSLELQQRAAVDLTSEFTDRPHVHVVSRPPEWIAGSAASDSDGDSTGQSDSEDLTENEEDGGTPIPTSAESTPDRGIALSFPALELYGIELLELATLSITVKCERCRDHTDVKNVPLARAKGDAPHPKVEACKKCANPMSIGFRPQLMHPDSIRSGYLDLDGCTVVDLLPSSFIPTCAGCSTAFSASGVNAVRGEGAAVTCRQCHRKMMFKIPDVKFLIVGALAASSRSALPRQKRPKEALGIVAGQELPHRGRCVHYRKSCRWFRFSCCAKVFPCDKCHDADTDHPNEHANRMICGFCSREQTYRPSDCAVCHATLAGKASSGFWEGGRGTRSKVLMSRKDPRKYKRRGATAPGTGSSKRK